MIFRNNIEDQVNDKDHSKNTSRSNSNLQNANYIICLKDIFDFSRDILEIVTIMILAFIEIIIILIPLPYTMVKDILKKKIKIVDFYG